MHMQKTHECESQIMCSMTLKCVCVCSGRGDSDGGDTEGRRSVRYPDSHQLFVGNLPHDIDEGELKDFFMSKTFTL